jgi:SAM-dependent methyltransferase
MLRKQRAARADRRSRPPLSTGGNPSPGRGDGYVGKWDPSDLAQAMQLIYNTDDVEAFEAGGKNDAESLSKHFDRSSTVLDLGCGIGRVAKYVAPNCETFWGVDVSSEMLEIAQKRLADCPNARWARSTRLGFPDVPSASVDLAYSLLVLQHVEREDAFLLLEELRRVVKPSGTIVVTYPNFLSDVYLAGFLAYAHDSEPLSPVRARAYTPQEVEVLMGAAGFSPEIVAGNEIWVTARPV